MFTDADKRNLINELNIELENNTFYNNPLISKNMNEKNDDSYSAKNDSSSFGKLPKSNNKIAFSDTVFSSKVSLDDIKFENKPTTTTFNSDGLFRPLVNKETVNIKNNVYNYTTSYATPVHGIAFEKNGGYVENPLKKPCNIVDNIYKKTSTGVLENDNSIKETSKEISVMADLIENTESSQVMCFASVPKELSLIPSSSVNKLKRILYKDIDVKGFFMQEIDLKSILLKQIDIKGFLLKEIDVKGAFKSAFNKIR